MKGRYCKLTHSSNKQCSVKVGGRAVSGFLEIPNFLVYKSIRRREVNRLKLYTRLRSFLIHSVRE